MANVIIVGMQWGDEGKGKIVDLLCPAFDVVVRFQGGHNAGHTVRFGDRHFSLHLVPSGILHPELRCVLGNGMVVSPEAFFQELDRLHGAGVETTGRLFLSRRAHAVLPPHITLDAAREGALGEGKIGTTSRGIGPAYETKVARFGIRLCDFAAPDIEERLALQRARIQAELAALGAPELPSLESQVESCRAWATALEPYLADTEELLHGWIEEGKRLLFEGAQGTLLDVDHGTYPFVTSSNATAGGVCTGTGVPPTRISGVLGVLKAYTTRVGEGPFITEVPGEVGEFLRRRGNEFGTTTGRPRRCGWLDLVAARRSRILNGVEAVALTKLDVLDALEEIPVCVGYRVRGEVIRHVPAEREALDSAEPVLKGLKGWRQETVGIVDYDDLPQAARDYIQFIEEEVGAPVVLVSTGPRREETILRPHPTLERLTSGRLESVVAQRQVG